MEVISSDNFIYLPMQVNLTLDELTYFFIDINNFAWKQYKTENSKYKKYFEYSRREDYFKFCELDPFAELLPEICLHAALTDGVFSLKEASVVEQIREALQLQPFDFRVLKDISCSSYCSVAKRSIENQNTYWENVSDRKIDEWGYRFYKPCAAYDVHEKEFSTREYVIPFLKDKLKVLYEFTLSVDNPSNGMNPFEYNSFLKVFVKMIEKPLLEAEARIKKELK